MAVILFLHILQNQFKFIVSIVGYFLRRTMCPLTWTKGNFLLSLLTLVLKSHRALTSYWKKVLLHQRPHTLIVYSMRNSDLCLSMQRMALFVIMRTRAPREIVLVWKPRRVVANADANFFLPCSITTETRWIYWQFRGIFILSWCAFSSSAR